MFRVSGLLIEHFPVIKQATIEALDAVFAPKAVARQLALAVAIQTGAVRTCVNVVVCAT